MSGLALGIGAIGLLAGLMIGCVGVGGIIVVPALVYGVGMPIQDAIASAMMGYILTGALGTAVYAHAKSIRWELAGWIALGAGPGALVGAWLGNGVDPRLLELAVGALALWSGLNSVFRSASAEESDRGLQPAQLVAVGAVTGVLSALTGTGGPLVLVPILIWLRLPTLAAIGLSQAAQIPIAILATVGNFAYGDPDVSMGLALGIGLAAGTWGGAKLAHVMPRKTLGGAATAVLIVVGVLICARLAYHQIA
jgi:uncharacterized membrane protein YfcA